MIEEKLREAKRDFKKEFGSRCYVSGVGIGDNCLNVYLTSSLQDEWQLPRTLYGVSIEYIVTGEIRRLII